MKRVCRSVDFLKTVAVITFVFSMALFFWTSENLFGAQLFMKDGRHLQGKLGTLQKIGTQPAADAGDDQDTVDIQAVVFLDDDLRRTYVPRFQIGTVNQDDPLEVEEKFSIEQKVRVRTPVVSNVGKVSVVDPFDDFGRRIVSMNTPSGPIDIIQGVTELTPTWVKVEGITHVWDMRMASSSLPPAVLDRILFRQVRPGDVEGIKKIARFYIQAQRYEDASRVLKSALNHEGLSADAKTQLEGTFRIVEQMTSRRILDELKVRESSGQYQLVELLLEKFPTEGVSSEILQEVRRRYQLSQAEAQKRIVLLGQMKDLYGRIDSLDLKKKLAPAIRDIVVNINRNTMGRLASFSQLADDDTLKPEERLSLAVSGWLLGANNATPNIAISLSAFRVRGLISEYLAADSDPARKKILARFRSEEAAAVRTVSQILQHSRPPEEIDSACQITDDFYRMSCVNVFDGSEVEYFVQLPPEYDPMRTYPAVICLHGAYSSPQLEVDWWAGSVNEKGMRVGQAGRQGYIIISPQWTYENAQKYDYSGSSHGAVLAALQHANRHFSIDTDRVFLSGHSMGGAAAWDIGLAHPDLWAGVIMVGALVDKYPILYWNNARHVPLYFICGQLDGGLLMANSVSLNRYMRGMYDVTVVEYLGRGHEDFQDEILRLFDWMNRKKRNFSPDKFEVKTMRTWDNFFWWAELANFPEKSINDPIDWPLKRGIAPSTVSGSVNKETGVILRTAAGKATIWLGPQLVDFEQKLSILVNGKKVNLENGYVEPNLEVLLEDVRTRGDRQNPFWAKVEYTDLRKK